MAHGEPGHLGDQPIRAERPLAEPVTQFFSPLRIGELMGVGLQRERFNPAPCVEVVREVNRDPGLDRERFQFRQDCFRDRAVVILLSIGVPLRNRGEETLGPRGTVRIAGLLEMHARHERCVVFVRDIGDRGGKAEVLGRDDQVLQRTADTEIELPLVRVGHPQPARKVGMEIDPVIVDPELPGLGVVARGSEYGVTHQEGGLFPR